MVGRRLGLRRRGGRLLLLVYLRRHVVGRFDRELLRVFRRGVLQPDVDAGTLPQCEDDCDGSYSYGYSYSYGEDDSCASSCAFYPDVATSLNR